MELAYLKLEPSESLHYNPHQSYSGQLPPTCSPLGFPPTTAAGFHSGYTSYDHADRSHSRSMAAPMEYDPYNNNNPYTPGSERSASHPPSLATDFDSSFGSVDSLSFELTPPSSAVSTCFPVEMEDGINYTPTRYETMVDASMGQSHCNGAQYPPQHVEQYHFADSVPSFFIPTPSHTVKGHISGEMPQTWALGDSPVNFERKSSPLSSLSSPMSHENCENVKRKLFTEARQKTNALRKIQGSGPGPRHNNAKRCGKTAPLLVEVSVAPSRKFKCDWPECQAKFKRTEHLKRHINSIHLKLYNVKCEFCNKTFNRGDNYESHLDLHANPDNKTKKTKRTDYYAAATSKLAVIKDARERRSKKEMQRIKSDPDS